MHFNTIAQLTSVVFTLIEKPRNVNLIVKMNAQLQIQETYSEVYYRL